MAYSSKYYDPVKAHKYYMKHRKLKGRKKKSPEEQAKAKRRSLKGLNESGKAAAAYVKSAIMAERKADYKKVNKACTEKIKALRAEWKKQGLTKEQMKEKAKEVREKFKEYKKKLKDVYDEKYLQELDKIKQDPSMRKAGKSKKR